MVLLSNEIVNLLEKLNTTHKCVFINNMHFLKTVLQENNTTEKYNKYKPEQYNQHIQAKLGTL